MYGQMFTNQDPKEGPGGHIFGYHGSGIEMTDDPKVTHTKEITLEVRHSKYFTTMFSSLTP